METPMNTHADTARKLGRHTDAIDGARIASLRSSARKLAAWWSADPMSASFSAEREHDRRLHQRVAGR
jgi:hypothetical protein